MNGTFQITEEVNRRETKTLFSTLPLSRGHELDTE
jgi:hypothetical protein